MDKPSKMTCSPLVSHTSGGHTGERKHGWKETRIYISCRQPFLGNPTESGRWGNISSLLTPDLSYTEQTWECPPSRHLRTSFPDREERGPRTTQVHNFFFRRIDFRNHPGPKPWDGLLEKHEVEPTTEILYTLRYLYYKPWSQQRWTTGNE